MRSIKRYLWLISTPLFPLPLWAAFYDYTPMESLPGFAKTGDFYQLLQDLYKFGVWLAIISAFFMLVVGGYMYLVSAGNKSTVDEAKKIISNALVGLVCALIAWLLLYTLNPDLVKINKLSMQETGSNTTTGGSTTGGETTTTCTGSSCQYGGGTCQATPSHEDNVKALKNLGIATNRGYADCSKAGDTACTSLCGLPSSVISGLSAIKSKCGATPIVTGGTEAGHKSHGIGKSVVDIGSSNTALDLCVKNNAGDLGIKQICAQNANYRYGANCSDTDGHLHLRF